MKYTLSNVNKLQNLAWRVSPRFGKHYMYKCMKCRRKRYSVEAAVTRPLKWAYNNFFMFSFIVNDFFSFVQDDRFVIIHNQLSHKDFQSMIDCNR